MRGRAAIGILLAVVGGAAQGGHSVNDLMVLVRTAITNQQSDGTLAKAVRKFKLTERLDGRVVEQLESEGAGPQAAAQLDRLRQASARLPKPRIAPLFDMREAPGEDEQKRMVAAARERALDYTRSLPDFICNEVIRRFDESKDKLIDTLSLQLTFSGQREHYKLLKINGRPTARSYDSVGGVINEGEFASLLQEVFDPKSETEFQWDHWTTLRKRPAQVYGFQVTPATSRYRMSAVGRSERFTAPIGQRGLVYVDRETSRTLRIIAEAYGMPADFPVRSSTTTLDYDYVDIAGRPFLLPLRAETRMHAIDRQVRNEVEFQSYRKFGADTSITFDPRY